MTAASRARSSPPEGPTVGPGKNGGPPTLPGVPADPEPPELARLVDYAERARVGDWSLRSALVRYAQGQPQRVSDVLDLVRRIEFALHPHARMLVAEGPDLWAALSSVEGRRAAPSQGAPPPPAGSTEWVLELLRAMQPLDAVADELAAWAEDQTRPRPDAAVDAAVAAVRDRIDALGVPHEERQRPPARRRG
jgi:hypothetical protein